MRTTLCSTADPHRIRRTRAFCSHEDKVQLVCLQGSTLAAGQNLQCAVESAAHKKAAAAFECGRGSD
jgi:hypothetical protein